MALKILVVEIVISWTPLHKVAQKGNPECLQLLIENGANLDAMDIECNSPLHVIAFSLEGNEEDKERCTEILVFSGADPNARNKLGESPLHTMTEFGRLKSAQVLIENGADVNGRFRFHH